MTSRAADSISRRASSRVPGAHAMVLGAVLALSTTLGGCGMSVLKHRGDHPAPRSLPGDLSPAERVSEARDQSALAPSDPYWPCRLGELYLAADSLARAEAAFKTALGRDSSYAPALSQLSKLYFGTGRHQEAVQMLEAARSNPERFPDGMPPALLTGLALHYDALDRADLASGVMAAIPRSGRSAAGSSVVYLLLRGSDPDSASDLARSDLNQNPKSAARQNNYGITRLRAGDPSSARRAFLEAIELDPSLPGPYYNLAILEKYYALDDSAATRWFTLYRSRSSDDPDGLGEVFGKSEAKVAEKRNEP